MVPSLPLLSCESSVSVKENPDRKKSFIYRLISLLFNLDKVFEGIVYNRLCKFIEENNLTYNLQLGFLEKHSTLYALLHQTEKIR